MPSKEAATVHYVIVDEVKMRTLIEAKTERAREIQIEERDP
jgi:hypothetical protein